MIVVVEGINPEPWRSPRLGTRRASGKVFPAAYKDENLRSYQEAVKETVEEELLALGYELPIFEAGTPLVVTFCFWRQLDSYKTGESRAGRRQQPDVTNLVKATEDAMQGIFYKTDRNNVLVQGTLVDVGTDVEPRVLIEVEAETTGSWRHHMAGAVDRLRQYGQVSKDGSVIVSAQRV